MSTFEPAPVRTLCANSVNVKDRNEFIRKWKKNVESRWTTWSKNRSSQSTYLPQLEWEANICEYVSFLASQTRPSKASGAAELLRADIPFLGPHFVPPAFIHHQKRLVTPEITPDITYLKPLNVVHPFYYPELAFCPQCNSDKIEWNGWTPTGHREVHGVSREETAIGTQLRCNVCMARYGKNGVEEGKGKYCWATTNMLFYERKEHWQLPSGAPIFFQRCALTSDLFNLIIELRPSTTAAGLSENIKQLHLLEYHKQRLAYLQAYQTRSQQKSTIMPHKAGLRAFSRPESSGKKLSGYDGTSITDDLITDVFAKFSEQTRKNESEESMRTKSAVTISLDATFRSASKATVVGEDNARSKLFTGGLHTVINEHNLILAFRFCHTQLNAEVEEMLTGLKRRFALLGVAEPEMAVVDNCCHVKKAIRRVFPDIAVVLDVWHFLMRYMICVLGGTKNPLRSEVARSIVDAILKSPADKQTPARYWSQEEQETRLIGAYEKWVARGGVWNAAADKTHKDQLEHVRKGCLARPRDDIRSDGSRIEGSHKGWNGLQRSHASGLETLTSLCYDFVLRRNLRVELSGTGADPSPFALSTYGSHHVHLVHACAKLWNELLAPADSDKPPPAGLRSLPELVPANSGETFGIIKASAAVVNYHNLVAVKEEPVDLVDLSTEDPAHTAELCNELGIDPALILVPQQRSDTLKIEHTVSNCPPSILPDEPQASAGAVHAGRAAATRHVGGLVGEQNNCDTTSRPPSAIGLSTATNTVATSPPVVIDVDAISSSEASMEVTIKSHKRRMSEAEFNIRASQQAAASETAALSSQHFPAGGPVPKKPRVGPVSSTATTTTRHSSSAISSASTPPATSGTPAPPTTSSTLAISRTPAPLTASRTPAPLTASRTPALIASSCTSVLPGTSRTSTPPAISHPTARLATSSTSAPSTAAPPRPLHPFFASHVSSGPPPTCLPPLSISGLTRSQRIISVYSGIEPRSLSFTNTESDGFFLFMRLRAEQKWASYNMSPSKWVDAASIYNAEVDRLNALRGKHMVRKTARALMEKLGDIEARVLSRIASNDYRSKRSGDESFWREHCHAVPLTKGDTTSNGTPRRKVHTCSRCKSIMWARPEGTQTNHKKGYCSDGVKQKPPSFDKTLPGGQTIRAIERLPQWPQPSGIFTTGTTFNARRFYEAVQELYDKAVVQNDIGGDRAMEYLALSSMLQERLLVVQETDDTPFMVLFELFATLELRDCPPETVVERDGVRYLRINYLDDNKGTAAHAVLQV